MWDGGKWPPEMDLLNRKWFPFDLPRWAEGPWAPEIHFALAAFAVGFVLVILLALRYGHQIHRAFYVASVAIAALFQIAWALMFGLIGWYAAKSGYRWLDSRVWWTWSNAMAVLLFGVALWAAMRCLAGIAEAMPGILPRRVSTGPGSSRFATRAEQRRGGII